MLERTGDTSKPAQFLCWSEYHKLQGRAHLDSSDLSSISLHLFSPLPHGAL